MVTPTGGPDEGLSPSNKGERLKQKWMHQHINTCLGGWHLRQSFGYYDHGTTFEEKELPVRDRIHLTNGTKG